LQAKSKFPAENGFSRLGETPLAGNETQALWRETGEWWNGEPERVVHRYLDQSGVRREEIKPLKRKAPLESAPPRIRRLRDEKVAEACGYREAPEYGTANPDLSGVALHTVSGYSIGYGAMIAAEIPALAMSRGYGATLLADRFSLTGAIEFHQTAVTLGARALIGASLEMAEGGELVLVARTAIGYRSLSRLVSDCHLEEPRLFPLCNWERLERHTADLLCLTGGDAGPLNRFLIRRDYQSARCHLQRLIGLYGRDNVFVQIERTYLPWQISVNGHLLQLAEELGLTPVAGGPILQSRPDDFPAQDVLVCIETLCAINELDGRKPHRDLSQPQIESPPRRELNAERSLRPIEELKALYADRPDLLNNGWRIVERCDAEVLPGRTNLPRFCDDEEAVFYQIVKQGALSRYSRIDKTLSIRLNMETKRIIRLGFSRHFLVAWDMCNWARDQGIQLSGRGSVVDSVVAYCLGMSRIDPIEHKLHFDRFLPANAQKRPDIDIDFEARRRDDVRQYLVRKYGDEHVATVAAIGTFCTRGIVREVGKVMGIPEKSLGYLAKRLHGSVSAHSLEEALDGRPELRDSDIPRERFRWVFELSKRLMDIPRNMRSHSSGVVISETPIADTVPVMWSAVGGVKIIQWDKRSAKKCFDKFDVLCLRGNDVLGDTHRRVSRIEPDFDVTDLPLDDPNVYRTMRAGELIGIPQSASPAMRQAHIRIKTKDLKDAGIVQAAIRPGVGGAVKLNEFVARRGGKPYRLIHEKLYEILEETLGIVVFQEQINQLLQEFGKYTSDQAEIIRESIYRNRREGFAEGIHDQVVAQIIAQGHTRTVAEEVYQLVAGFKGYGFAQGHALAFAEVSIRSIYCQQNYPAEYFAAILDAQPAGYYGPCTLVNEARIRGVKILPPDINRSDLKFSVEDVKSPEPPHIVVPNAGIRVSLSQIEGLSKGVKERVITAREAGPFQSFYDFTARVEIDRDELEKLILCGVFDSLHGNRRSLLWAIPDAVKHGALVRVTKSALPLFIREPVLPYGIEDFSDGEKALHERSLLGLDVERHLLSFEREKILAKGGITAGDASRLKSTQNVFVVGNPIRLRFPPTSSGKRVMFFDLEDETGLLNVTCFDDVYQRDGHKVICNPYITLWGETQDRDGHIAFLAHRIYPYKPVLNRDNLYTSPLPVVTADFLIG
jgi:error-prone DNA polymerase